MSYAAVNGLSLYYESRGDGRPLVLLHGGVLTIELSFGSLLEPLSAGRRVVALELQGHGRTADTGRPMTMAALAGDVTALLDQLGIAEADVFGFSLGGLVGYGLALSAPDRVRRLVVASADALHPPGRESVPLTEDRLPTAEDFAAMGDAYRAVAPDPSRFEDLLDRTSALVHDFPGWTADQLRSLRARTLLVFGEHDFSPLSDVAELSGVIPHARIAVLPRTTHMGVPRHPALPGLVTRFLDEE